MSPAVPPHLKSFGAGSKYSHKDVMLLHQTFCSLDKSGDGQISIAELQVSLPKVDHSKHQISELQVVRSLDVNKDGMVSFEEMLKRLYPLANAKEIKVMYKWAYPDPEEAPVDPGFVPTAQQLQDLKDMFKIYDKNNNGGLEYKELVEMSGSVGYDPSELDSLFKASDKANASTCAFI
eukprot:gene24888-10553_t